MTKRMTLYMEEVSPKYGPSSAFAQALSKAFDGGWHSVTISVTAKPGSAKIDEAVGEDGSKPQQEDVFPDEAPRV